MASSITAHSFKLNMDITGIFLFLGMAHRDLKPENILCESAHKVSSLQRYLCLNVFQRAADVLIKLLLAFC